MDVIWNGESLLLAGPDTRMMWADRAPCVPILGVRLSAGHGARLIAASAEALRDARLPLELWWGDAARRLSDRLAHEAEPRRALEHLELAVSDALLRGAPQDALVLEVVRALAHDAPGSVASMAKRMGVSERQLLRRCLAQLGYGPKFCLRVLRFQRFMDALRSGPECSLSTLAFDAGYADQAHLGHEVAELAGATPGQLRDEARAASVSDKTAASAQPHALPHEHLRR